MGGWKYFGSDFGISAGFECCVNITSDRSVHFDRGDFGDRAGKKEPPRRAAYLYPGVPGFRAGHDDQPIRIYNI